MDRLRMLTVVLILSVAVAFAWVDHAAAQIRVQETPAIDGLGSFLFRDVSLQLDAGYGNDSPILPGNDEAATRASAGIFVDKPFLSYFFDIFYDRDRYLGEPLERDTWTRDLLIEPLRFVAHYRVGNFAVLRGDNIKDVHRRVLRGHPVQARSRSPLPTRPVLPEVTVVADGALEESARMLLGTSERAACPGWVSQAAATRRPPPRIREPPGGCAPARELVPEGAIAPRCSSRGAPRHAHVLRLERVRETLAEAGVCLVLVDDLVLPRRYPGANPCPLDCVVATAGGNSPESPRRSSPGAALSRLKHGFESRSVNHCSDGGFGIVAPKRARAGP